MASRIPMLLTTLKIDISSTPTLIPNVVSVDTWFDGSAAEIDITDLDNLAMQVTTGLLNYGKLSFKINYDPSNASHAAILSQWVAKTVTATFLGTFTDTGAATLQTVGPITMFKWTGGSSNSLNQVQVEQKINSYTITP